MISKEEWDKIRLKVFKRANYKCEICGGKGDKWPVECHEIWEYNDVNKDQKLTGFIALCPDCHACKHIGLAIKRGAGKKCKEHLMKINQMSFDDANNYIKEVFRQWKERSKYNWTLDIALIKE